MHLEGLALELYAWPAGSGHGRGATAASLRRFRAVDKVRIRVDDPVLAGHIGPHRAAPGQEAADDPSRPRSRPTISVQEAGRLFGLGKTKSYEEAHRYLRSDGREGLPTSRFRPILGVPDSTSA